MQQFAAARVWQVIYCEADSWILSLDGAVLADEVEEFLARFG